MTKKKVRRLTTEQKVERAVKKALDERPTNSIQDCHFVGVEFDKSATKTIKQIALGLTENAKALGALAETLNSNHVHLDSFVSLPLQQEYDDQ